MAFDINTDLKTLGDRVIYGNDEFEDIREISDRIAYITCDRAKKNGGKTVFADTERVKDKYKLFMPYDFVITFYSPNIEDLDAKRLEILMYHELKHVGYDPVEYKCFIVPHDVEDFRDLIKKYGVDWVVGDE